jgi:hypothetical protein
LNKPNKRKASRRKCYGTYQVRTLTTQEWKAEQQLEKIQQQQREVSPVLVNSANKPSNNALAWIATYNHAYEPFL